MSCPGTPRELAAAAAELSAALEELARAARLLRIDLADLSDAVSDAEARVTLLTQRGRS